jgi:hypothetical protein
MYVLKHEKIKFRRKNMEVNDKFVDIISWQSTGGLSQLHGD